MTQSKIIQHQIRTCSPIGVAALVMAFTSGCEISDQAKVAIHESLTEAPQASPTMTLPVSSTAPACFVDHFQQPAEQISHSVDILFVADTSGSMANKRLKVANALYAFVGALPAGTDYRIGVVLAHGSTDPNNGRLYSTAANPRVLDSAVLPQAQIQEILKQVMLAAPDVNWEEGEMGSYALLQALKPANLAESRSLGFFRPDAALSIITISDENDICAVYPNPLPADFHLAAGPYPSMPGMVQSEYNIRRRDCPNGISTHDVINAVKSVQGDRPFVFGAVIHPDINYSSDSNSGGESYGWGYGEVVHENHGVLVDIANGDYSSGLSLMGALTSIKIQLLTDFTLTRSNVAADSIHVAVDRNTAPFSYNANQNEVHLLQLGSPLSEIDVNYCLNTAGTPLPTPTVSPIPTASPTATASPTPSPSPSPSVTPTASPTPTPSPTCSGPFCGSGSAA